VRQAEFVPAACPPACVRAHLCPSVVELHLFGLEISAKLLTLPADESGGKPPAVQTVRDDREWLANAERLACACWSTALTGPPS